MCVTGATFQLLSLDQLDQIKTLWENHNTYSVSISAHFPGFFGQNKFEDVKRYFIEKSKVRSLRVEIGTPENSANCIAYCLASFSSDKQGEIESLYVDPTYRNNGIGTALMNNAIEWMDQNGTVVKSVGVLPENGVAFRFYARFGFYPALVSLVKTKSA